MVSFRSGSYDHDMAQDDPVALLGRILASVERRRLVLAAPTPRPPPREAWAPGELSVQLPVAGRIQLAVPDGEGERWTTIDRHHLLVVCPGSWSPRTRTTARRHLALSFGPRIGLAIFDTPAGGGNQGPVAHRRVDHPGPALAAAREAAATCAVHAPTPTVLRALLLGLLPLLHAESSRSTQDDPTRAIRAELRTRCGEDLTRDGIAARFGIGGDHLTRLLRATGGEGFGDLLRRYRLERATALLRDGEASIAAIAEECGFGTATWFIRCFRRAHGTTPAAWRRAWRSAAGSAPA